MLLVQGFEGMLENKRDMELMLFIYIMQTNENSQIPTIPPPFFVLVMVFAFVGW